MEDIEIWRQTVEDYHRQLRENFLLSTGVDTTRGEEKGDGTETIKIKTKKTTDENLVNHYK